MQTDDLSGNIFFTFLDVQNVSSSTKYSFIHDNQINSGSFFDNCIIIVCNGHTPWRSLLLFILKNNLFGLKQIDSRFETN